MSFMFQETTEPFVENTSPFSPTLNSVTIYNLKKTFYGPHTKAILMLHLYKQGTVFENMKYFSIIKITHFFPQYQSSSGLESRTRTTTRRTLTRTCMRPRLTRTKTSSTPFSRLLQVTRMNVSMTWSWHDLFPSPPFPQKIACPLSQTKVCWGFENRQLFSLRITRLHHLLANKFDFTKSQCLWRKVAILSLHQFSSFKDPVRNHTREFRWSLRCEEHDRGNLRGRTPRLRDSPEGELYSSWPALMIQSNISNININTNFKRLDHSIIFPLHSGYLKDSLQIYFAKRAGINLTAIERHINVYTRLDSNSLF